MERGKKTRQTEEEVGRQHQGMARPGVRQVPEGSGEQGEMEKNWLQNYLWCPNDPRGYGIDDVADEVERQYFEYVELRNCLLSRVSGGGKRRRREETWGFTSTETIKAY